MGGMSSSPSLAAFHDEVETFFDDVLPGALEGVSGTIPRAKAWRNALFDHGLAAIDYLRVWFVHLSTASQVPGTLRRFFTGRSDLVLLTIAVVFVCRRSLLSRDEAATSVLAPS